MNSDLVITAVKDADAVKEVSFGREWNCSLENMKD